MKLKTIIICFAVVLISCKNSESANNSDISYTSFGDSITAENAISKEELLSKFEGMKEGDTINLKFTSKIKDVCQKKGCWMVLNIGSNKMMRVKFKDYGFFVPKDAAGKTIIIEGVAFSETTSVATLRHYAEDAEKSQEEINKITEPETEIAFEAHGVILKK